jgi:hypothetical protein
LARSAGTSGGAAKGLEIRVALTGPGTRQLNPDCAAFPVPFRSPTPPATTYAFQGPSRDSRNAKEPRHEPSRPKFHDLVIPRPRRRPLSAEELPRLRSGVMAYFDP